MFPFHLLDSRLDKRPCFLGVLCWKVEDLPFPPVKVSTSTQWHDWLHYSIQYSLVNDRICTTRSSVWWWEVMCFHKILYPPLFLSMLWYSMCTYVSVAQTIIQINDDKRALWNAEPSSMSWEPVDIFRLAVSNGIHIVPSSSSVGIGFQYKVASAHLGTLGTQQLPDQTRRADQIFATSVCFSESPMIGIGGSYCCFLPFLIDSDCFFVILCNPLLFLFILLFYSLFIPTHEMHGRANLCP